MRAPLALGMTIALVALSPLANAGYAQDAYVVAGFHPNFGAVTGYLQIRIGQLSEIYLVGALPSYFHARFTFTCDEYLGTFAKVQECGGYQGARFVGAYAVDEDGDATGPAAGQGVIHGFQLVARDHT